MRTGAEYLNSLNDGRQVFVEGERVKDVTTHPAFREAARSVARLYDIAAAPENRELMTFTSPKTGKPVWRAYQIPRTHADLRARRLFSEKWAEATLRPDGPHARPCRGLLHRLCRGAGGVRRRRAEVRRQRRRVLREDARRASLSQLRDRSAADRPQQAGAQAERSDALCRRGEGARRRHRHLRRAAACDRRRAVRLAASELHSSAAAGRRELRQLRRRADQRAGREALSRAGRSRCAPTIRSTIRCRAGSTSPTATWCSTTCSCRGSTSSSTATSRSPATSGGRRRRIRSATIRRRCATSPSCAS